MLTGQPIPRVHSISCCLGFTLDETISWDEHSETICKKVGKGRTESYIPEIMLQSIYSALVQPYSINYCSPLWDICNKRQQDKLQKFQNRAARIIAGASYEIRSADVLRALEWENLDSRRGMSKATLLYKLLNGCSAPNLKELLTRRNSATN